MKRSLASRTSLSSPTGDDGSLRRAHAALTVLVGLVLAILPLSPAGAGVVSICSGFDGCASAGRDTFGWQDVYTQSFWGQYAGHNCTNFVAYRLQQRGAAKPVAGAMGNAENWGYLLRMR